MFRTSRLVVSAATVASAGTGAVKRRTSSSSSSSKRSFSSGGAGSSSNKKYRNNKNNRQRSSSPSSSSSLPPPSAAELQRNQHSNIRKAQAHEQPYSWLFFATIERGCTADAIRLLCTHPMAPQPSELLAQLSEHVSPSAEVVGILLRKAVASALAVQQQSQQQHQQDRAAGSSSVELLNLWDQVQTNQRFMQDPALLERFCRSFLNCGLYVQVSAVTKMIIALQQEENKNKMKTTSSSSSTSSAGGTTSQTFLESTTWSAMLRACGTGKLRDSSLLWRLVQLPPERVQALVVGGGGAETPLDFLIHHHDFLSSSQQQRTPNVLLPSSKQTADGASSSNSSSSDELVEVAGGPQPHRQRREANCFPSSWGISASLAARLVAQSHVPLLCATHIMLRYLESEGSSSSSSSSSVACHPVPFMVYLNRVTTLRMMQQNNSAAAQSSPRLCVHWSIPWRMFQHLNKTNPTWYKQYPDEAETIVKALVEILAAGAPPQMAFVVARIASERGAVDGVDIALYLLNRFNLANRGSTPAVSKIVSQVFSWLTDVVQIHKRRARHGALGLTARVLIRFGMTEELSDLYTKVLDQASEMQHETRESLLHVMRDLVCPACCSILSHFDVHVDRQCDNCLETVPAKPLDERSSFELTQAHVKRLREKRKERKEAMMKRLRQSMANVSSKKMAMAAQIRSLPTAVSSSSSSSSVPPLESAEFLKRQVLERDDANLVMMMSTTTTTTKGSNNNADNFSSSQEQQTATPTLPWEAAPDTLVTRSTTLVVPTSSSSIQDNVTIFTEEQQETARSRKTSGGGGGGGAVVALALTAQQKQQREAMPWVCLWCHELNLPFQHSSSSSSSSSASCCTACGAETGPTAMWREPLQHQQKISCSSKRHNHKTNPMKEIAVKIRHAMTTRSLNDIVSASYYLMLYHKLFLLYADASRGDFVLAQSLVSMLVDAHEKTLAAHLFMKILPSSQRLASPQLVEHLAMLFSNQGSAPSHIIYGKLFSEQQEQEQEQEHKVDDKFIFSAIFGPNTCSHCFGVHASDECAIVTRKFASSGEQKNKQQQQQQQQQHQAASPLRTSPQEKLHMTVTVISQRIKALNDTSSEDEVISAYHKFVLSPDRELFATSLHGQANTLASHLCRVGYPKRAAFVICHIPLELRTNEVLTQLAGWFDLSRDDIATLLDNRVLGDTTKSTHPNVIQLTRYCCVCFNGQHASHACPRMAEWFSDATGASEKQQQQQKQKQKRISPKTNSAARCTQVNGWTSSGPERLYALYRFLLSEIDNVVESASSASASNKFPSEITHAINQCISRLVDSNNPQKSAAWRLFSRSPTSCLKRETIAKVLVANGVEQLLVEEMLKSPTVGNDWLQLAVPPTACLICFDTGHSFQRCPELTSKIAFVERMKHVLAHVARIRSDPARGVAAAADYFRHLFVCCQLPQDVVFRNTALATELAGLARKCFHFKMNVRGFNVLRRLPYSAINQSLVVSWWHSAGIAQDVIDVELMPQLTQHLQQAQKAVQALEEIHNNNSKKKAAATTNEDSSSSNNNSSLNTPEYAQAKRELAAVSRRWRAWLERGTCRHCHTSGHAIIDCDLFLEESSFGRDLLAIFRVLISHVTFTPEENKKLMIHLVQYLVHYHRHLPYHVVGVSRAMNSVASLMAMMQLPGIALRVLLSIPPTYRARHVYHHILVALGVSAAEKTRRSNEFLSQCNDASDMVTLPDSLMQVCSPTPDIAMSHVFAGIPNVRESLAEADKLLAEGANEIYAAADPSSDKNRNQRVVVLQSCYDPRRPPQSVDISEIRDAIDPTQRYIEDRIGIKIGSRHHIFTQLIQIYRDGGGSSGGDSSNDDAKGREDQ